MGQSTIIGGVELGTSKTVVLVGEVVDKRMLNIVGMGQTRSGGIKKGEIVDFKAASQSVHEALSLAEKSAGTTLDCVYLSQSGRHLKGFYNTGVVNVSASDNVVSRVDIERVKNNAKSKQLAPEHVYIHHIRNPFKLDGRVVENPYGMQGEKLEVSYWSVYGDVNKVKDHIHVINGYGLMVEDMIISSIASGSMVATESEKKNGVMVLDIGCGTTDYIIYKDGYVVKTGSIPVGGDHITSDLSLALRIGLDNAEKIKLHYGKACIDDSDKDEKVWLYGDKELGDRYVTQEAIYLVIQARVEELLWVVLRQIEEWVHLQALSAGVIVTGGCARLPMLDKMVQKVLNMDMRIGMNPDWASYDLKNPEYSTALGLLHYGLSDQKANEEIHQPEETLFKRVAKLFHV